nr:hypothetical protein [uncultured Flavobacterium sp.]
MNWLLFLKHEMKIDWSHPEDINGIWQSEKGYSIDFNGPNGALCGLDPLLYPLKLSGYVMYENLSYQGDGEWKAERYNWKFPPGEAVSNGSWQFEAHVVLQLTADKKAITDNWRTFRKIN